MDRVDGERVVLILDQDNVRVVVWTEGANEGVLRVFLGFRSAALALDEDGGLLIGSYDSVMRFGPGESKGVVIAGGNGCGNALDQVCMPVAIFRDHDKALLVLQRGPFFNNITRWVPGACVGELVAGGDEETGSFGGGIFSLKKFHGPTSMALAFDGSLVVADEKAGRVVKVSPGADDAVIIAPAAANVDQNTMSGIRGTSPDKLRSPMAVAFDGKQSLVIVDEKNDRVLRWFLGDSAGVVVAGGNRRGPRLNQLASPFDAAVDEDGSIVIVDRLNDRVVRWVPGASQGEVVAGGNGRGSRLDQLQRGFNKVVLGVWRAWNKDTHFFFLQRVSVVSTSSYFVSFV